MNQPPSLHEDLAAVLLEAEAQRTAIDRLTDAHPSLTMTDAYAVQESIRRRKLAAGAGVLGWKAGLTSRAMRDQMGVSQPNRGSLFDYCLLDGVLQRDELIHPRVEPEIAFVLGRELRGPGVTLLEVLAATRWVCAAIEVVDSRFKDYRFRVEDNTADNSSAARLVLGPAVFAVDSLDLSLVGVVLERNGEVEQTGAGAATLGHPARAVAWLANQLAESGQAIEAGQIVISGGLTSAPLVVAGDHVAARFDRLGAAELRVV